MVIQKDNYFNYKNMQKDDLYEKQVITVNMSLVKREPILFIPYLICYYENIEEKLLHLSEL